MSSCIRILSRIIELGVDAVNNAAYLSAVLADDRLQTKGISRIKNLPGVGRAYCGNCVGAFKSALHQVDAVTILKNVVF